MSAKDHAKWCRERVASHKKQAKESTGAKRRFHESEASSWAGEALFYEAMQRASSSRV